MALFGKSLQIKGHGFPQNSLIAVKVKVSNSLIAVGEVEGRRRKPEHCLCYIILANSGS